MPENGFDERRWGNIAVGGIQPLIRNLRDVNRVLSSIDIHLPMHKGERVFEVNILDFIALEVMRVFEPDLHTALAANKALLLQSYRYSGDRHNQQDREAVQALLTAIKPSGRAAWEALLKELFPPIEWALGGSHYGSGSWASRWMREKRVCTARSFDRYFTLQLPDGAMSESDFAAFTETAADSSALAAVVADLRQRGLLTALASRLDESVDDLPMEHFDNLLAAILKLGEEVGRISGPKDPFSTPFLSSWRAASWYLHRLGQPEHRSAALLRAMNATSAIAVAAVLISLDIARREKPEDGDKPPAFDSVGLERLRVQTQSAS